MNDQRYTSDERRILQHGKIIATVSIRVPSASEKAGLIASMLNGYIADELLLGRFAREIADRGNR